MRDGLDLREQIARIETKIDQIWRLIGAVFLMQIGSLIKAFWPVTGSY